MMNVNLIEFWTVQKASGSETYAFLSFEDAQKQVAIWNEELDNDLERWLAGDRGVSDSLISSTLEPDLEGGCYFSYHINDAWRPSGIYYHAKYSISPWENLANPEIISWGNPVLVRPVKV